MAGLKHGKHGIVVVIYIGTYSFDYAFSTFNRPEDSWSSPYGFAACILFNNNKEVVAFGQEATYQYQALCNDGKGSDYYFYRGFKTELFNSYINGELTIQDVKGKRLPSSHVLSTCIQHIKDKMTRQWSTLYEGYGVGWILLVPEVWKESLNHFMVEAARNAGINEEHFGVISESEAACIQCHRLYNKVIKHDRHDLPLETYSDTLVVDTGCEIDTSLVLIPAVDITVSVIRRENNPETQDEVSSWEFGSNPVDQMLNEFLSDVFGTDVMKEFKKDYSEYYDELFRTFHSKLMTSKDWRGKVALRFPCSLVDAFERKHSIHFKEHIRSNCQDIELGRDDQKFVGDKVIGLMKASFQTIIDCLKGVLDKSQNGNVRTIIIYGCLAESLLQTYIQEAIHDKRIIFPEIPTRASMQGALLYGHGVSSSKRKYTLFSEK